MSDRRPRLSSGESAPVRSRRPSLRDAAIAQTAGEFFNIGRGALSSRSDAETFELVRKMLFSAIPMDAEPLYDRSSSTLRPHDGSPGLPALLGAVAVVIGLTTWLVQPARRSSPSTRRRQALIAYLRDHLSGSDVAVGWCIDLCRLITMLSIDRCSSDWRKNLKRTVPSSAPC